jgi:hypothetical protein
MCAIRERWHVSGQMHVADSEPQVDTVPQRSVPCCAALRSAAVPAVRCSAVRSEGPVRRVLRLIVLRHLLTLSNAINRYSADFLSFCC